MHDVEKLIAEVDVALATVPSARRASQLRRIADLFLSSAEAYSDEQMAVFDSVIGRFMDKAERKMLADLSARLAKSVRAPVTVMSRLSSHESIEVSGPFLEKSAALPDEALAEICTKKSPKHIAAIAGRAQLSEALTDAIIERGDAATLVKIAANAEAKISELGFVKLIDRARRHKKLAKAIAGRNDVPAELQPFLDMVLGEAA